MSDISRTQMDRKMTELVGKILARDDAKQAESELYFLQMDRRKSVCDLPSAEEFQRQLDQSRRRSR